MKSVQILLLTGCIFLLTGCPGNRYEGAQENILKNHMDLPDPVWKYHDGIRFLLSNLFEDSYDSQFGLKTDAMAKVIYDLNLRFNVEKFSITEAESFRFAAEVPTTLLDAVHDNYLDARERSLDTYFSSVKKPISLRSGYKGFYQTVSGKRNFDGAESLYLMATIQVDNSFYVFQMIGKKENMGYLKDDFDMTIHSVKK